MKLEPCKTESGRHNWLWEFDGHGFPSGGRVRKMRGVYLCTGCGATKYGKTINQVRVVAPARGVAK